MAPSYDIGTPERSLVRMPGSGQNKSLKPICLDVAQISNFARCLSNIINFNFNAPPEQAMSGTLNITPVSPPIPPLKRVLENEEEGNLRKRPCVRKGIRLTPKEMTDRMKLLEEEERKLNEENMELNNKVAMFKDILRSRSKLKEFLQALKEMM